MILDNPHRASVIMRVLRSGGKETGKSASVMGCGEIPQATPAVKMPGGVGRPGAQQCRAQVRDMGGSGQADFSSAQTQLPVGSLVVTFNHAPEEF